MIGNNISSQQGSVPLDIHTRSMISLRCLGTKRYTNIPGSEGELIEQIKCFECNKMGHYTNSCAVVNEDLQLIQMGYAKD